MCRLICLSGRLHRFPREVTIIEGILEVVVVGEKRDVVTTYNRFSSRHVYGGVVLRRSERKNSLTSNVRGYTLRSRWRLFMCEQRS